MVVFLKQSKDRALFELALKKAEAIGFTIVDLEKDSSLASAFTETQSTLYVEGQKVADLSIIDKLVSESNVASLFPAECVKESLEAKLKRLINQDKVMLFMKGSPQGPQCGFSSRMVKLLENYVGTVIEKIGHFDILSDEEVREGLKAYSKWPTYP